MVCCSFFRRRCNNGTGLFRIREEAIQLLGWLLRRRRSRHFVLGDDLSTAEDGAVAYIIDARILLVKPPSVAATLSHVCRHLSFYPEESPWATAKIGRVLFQRTICYMVPSHAGLHRWHWWHRCHHPQQTAATTIALAASSSMVYDPPLPRSWHWWRW